MLAAYLLAFWLLSFNPRFASLALFMLFAALAQDMLWFYAHEIKEPISYLETAFFHTIAIAWLCGRKYYGYKRLIGVLFFSVFLNLGAWLFSLFGLIDFNLTRSLYVGVSIMQIVIFSNGIYGGFRKMFKSISTFFRVLLEPLGSESVSNGCDVPHDKKGG